MNFTKGVDGAFFTRKHIIGLRNSTDERGQSLVEFTLILPIFLLIVMGMIDFGWYLKLNNDLVRANSMGARVAAFSGSDYEIQQAVVDSGTTPLNITHMKVSIAREDPDMVRGTWVEVSTTTNYTSLTGFSPVHLLLNNKNITAMTTSRIE